MSKNLHILALHGFTGRGEDFAGFFSLCDSDIEWCCPDMPGHGPDPSLNCTPQAIIHFINGHKLPKPRIALGYSMGARAVLLHAINHPSYWDALILISATAGLESEAALIKRATHDQALAERLLNEDVPTFLRYWQKTPIIRSQQNIRPEWLARMQSNRQQHTAKGLATSLKQFGQAKYPNIWDKLNQLHCPVLLITGEQDDIYNAFARRMKTLLKQAQWASISDVGHAPHLEAPEQTAAVIKRFRNSALNSGCK